MHDIHRQMKSIISNRQCNKEIIFENDNINMTSVFGFKQGNFLSPSMKLIEMMVIFCFQALEWNEIMFDLWNKHSDFCSLKYSYETPVVFFLSFM